MSFVDILSFSGITLGVFFSILLLTSRFYRSRANNYFAYSLLLLAFISFDVSFVDNLDVFGFFSAISWRLLFPATLFVYFYSSLNRRSKTPKWINILYVPFIVFSFNQLVLDYFLEIDVLPLLVGNEKSELPIFRELDYYFALIYQIVLMVWAMYYINTYSDVNKSVRRWLYYVCGFILGVSFFWLFSEQMEFLFDLLWWDYVWASLSIFFLWVGYNGVQRLSLVEQKEEIRSLSSEISKPTPISINPDLENSYTAKLGYLMNEEKLFKNPDLGRDLIADRLQISTGYLTEIVKATPEKGFIDYVNKFRVEEAKKMLSNPIFDQFSINAIGMEAGFNSKSAFYRAFQKFTGNTPGDYKKKNKKS